MKKFSDFRGKPKASLALAMIFMLAYVPVQFMPAKAQAECSSCAIYLPQILNANRTFLSSIFDAITDGFLALNKQLSAGFGALTGSIATSTEATVKATEAATNTKIQADRANAQAQSAAAVNARHVIQPTSTQCAIAQATPLVVKGEQVRDATVHTLESLLLNENTGKKADSTSPTAMAEYQKARCDLGFISDYTYDGKAQKMGCKADAKFAGADLDLTSLIGPTQYSIPKTALMTESRQIVFPFATDKEKPFIAAFYFVKNMIPVIPTPVAGNTSVTPGDINNIGIHAKYSTQVVTAVHTLLDAIGKRVACPKDLPADVVKIVTSTTGTTTSCHDDEEKLCKQLFDRNVISDNEFSNCQTDGMSLQQYEFYEAHRCNANYLLRRNTVLMADKVEELAEDKCQEWIDEYNDRLNAERARIENAVNVLNNLKGGGASPNPLARPINTGSGSSPSP